MVDVPVGGHPGQGGDDRPRLCLAGDLDDLHRKDDRAVARRSASCAGRSPRSAMRDRWRRRSSRSAQRTACCRRCWRRRCARRGCRRASPATAASRNARPRALPRSCAPKRAASGSAWDACHHRCDLAIRRAVRHRLGHHEQLYRHLEIADHESRRGGAGHRRGAARHRVRSGRGDPGRDHLQSFFARDQRLPRTGRPLVRRRRPVAVARSRPHPHQFSRHTRSRAAE